MEKKAIMNNVINYKSSLAYIASLVMILAYWGNSEKILFWELILLVLGNTRRIPKSNQITYFFRMTIYFTIFLIPAVLAQNRVLNGLNGQWWVVLVAMLVGAAVFAAEYSKTKLVIVGEMLFADSKEEDFARVLIIYNLIGAAICEEYFFRYYLIGDRYFNWIYMLISAIMFLLYHASLPWGDKYRFVDYAKQFGAGIVSAALYSFSRSLIPCIIFHLLCNSSEIFVCLNMLLVKKRDDGEDEIDIDL